jgi:hypothetical protein
MMLTIKSDREEALKDDFPLEGSAYDDEDEDDEWAGDDNAWAEEDEQEEEQDAKDESSAYLEFLNEEAQKFQNLEDNDSDDELGEESLLETPLDKIEPYQLFKNALMSMLPLAFGCTGFESDLELTSCRTPSRTTPTLRISHHEPQP